jgi:predicted cytidylate kinase
MIRAITLSGEAASGKSSLAHALLAALPGWRGTNTGQKVREYLASSGPTFHSAGYLPDEINNQLDTEQRQILETASQVVVEGRLAGWFAQGLEDVLKIYCYAPHDIRIMRYRRREQIPTKQAIADLETRDQQDVEHFHQLYGIADYRSSAFYDLRIDTSQGTPAELARLIIEQPGLFGM